MTDRLRRLLLVVPAARARPGISVAELAKALACDVDELRQDIDLLACVGRPPFQPNDLIDIELREDDRVWVTLPQAFDRPARLLATEAAALTIAARRLGPNDPVLRGAVEKLSRAVQPAQRPLYEGLAGQLAFVPPAAPSGIEAALARAITNRLETEIAYYAPTERAARVRAVRPREIATANGLRYLSAQNVDGDERLYRIDRISEVAARDTTFPPLPGIDLQAALARVAGFDRQAGLPHATLRFAAAVAAAARLRHPEARALPDGGAEAEVPYSTLPWLVSYAFSWGGHAIITAPAEAREPFSRAIGTALAAAGDSSSPEHRT